MEVGFKDSEDMGRTLGARCAARCVPSTWRRFAPALLQYTVLERQLGSVRQRSGG